MLDNEKLREALTPSGETKDAYSGEFSWTEWLPDENGIEQGYERVVPWLTIKEIMRAIRERAGADLLDEADTTALSTSSDSDQTATVEEVERVAKAMAVAAGYADYQWNSHGFKVHSLENLARAALAAIQSRDAAPIDMLLFCPRCHVQHVDEPSESWDNAPHRSHLCHACGCIWRPADVATNGVAAIDTKGSADNWDGQSRDAVLRAADEIERGGHLSGDHIKENRP